MECELVSYDDDSHILIAEIKNISVDEAVLDTEGNVDVAKLAPISFDPNTKKYYQIGDVVADARSVGKQLQ